MCVVSCMYVFFLIKISVRSVQFPIPYTSSRTCNQPRPGSTRKKISVSLTFEATFFLLDVLHPLCRTATNERSIQTEDSTAVRCRPYRIAPNERKVIVEDVAYMIRRNIIHRSLSSWSSSFASVEKKDHSARFSPLHKITKTDV